MKHDIRGLRVLAVVLLITALCVGRIPTLGGKAIIRAMLVSRAGGEWTVGLICMQPGQAADSADATEQMSASWGAGAQLAGAFAQAEEGLDGQAVYKLCDTAFVGGAAPLETLRALSEYIADSGSGRLAARVLYSDVPMQKLQNKKLDISALYADMTDAEEDAPRLYQAAGGSVLAPRVGLKGGDSLEAQGAACLTETQIIRLDEEQAQAAWLLQNSTRTFPLTEEGYPLTIQGLTGVEAAHGGETIVVRGLVRGLPSEQNARSVLLQKAQEKLNTQLLAAQVILSQAGIDAAHTQATQKLAFGTHKEQAFALQWDVKLQAE